MHVDVGPPEPYQDYLEAEDAIRHVIVFQVFAKNWSGGQSFGRHLAEIRRINKAIKDKDYSAFVAERRGRYWRVELADNV